MKFAMHDFKFTDLRPRDEDAIGEVIVEYEGQFAAMPIIEYYRKYGYRIVWEIDLASEIHFLTIEASVKELKELLEVYDNMAFKIPFPHKEFIADLPGTFLAPDYAAKTYQEAMSMFHIGLTECYVTGSLAANMTELIELSKIMKIRIVPNLVQTDAYNFGNPGETNPLECFWIRPESIALYADVVSTFEFATNSNHLEAGLLAIYIDEAWEGRIGDVIIDQTKVLDKIDNFYSADIDVSKSKCGLLCQKSLRCHLCQHIPYQANFKKLAEEKITNLKIEEKRASEES